MQTQSDPDPMKCDDGGDGPPAAPMRHRQTRLVLEHGDDFAWELDPGLRIMSLSAPRGRPGGLGGAGPIGRSLFSMLKPASALRIKRELVRQRRALNAGPLHFELELESGDGAVMWIEARSAPRHGDGGELIGFYGIARDITERKMYELALEQANRQLQAQLDAIAELQLGLQERADRDFLTGLYNRRYLEEALPRELARARREGYPLSLIMVDLDHFKRVNDAYGHATGDEALRSLSEMLLRGARGSDILARYGGEEFLIALPRMSLEHARKRAEEWRIELEGMPVVFGRNRVSLTLSAGISTFPDNGDVLESLIHLADAALYRAKSNGRNRVEHIEPAATAGSPAGSVFSASWKPEYACGHRKIDDEHRRLFELANALLTRMFEPAAAEDRNAAFDAFLAHMVDHFVHEEAILRSFKVEMASGHADEHKRLLERALLLRRRVQDGDAPVGELVDFVGNDVIAMHLLSVDRAFFQVFADSARQAGPQAVP